MNNDRYQIETIEKAEDPRLFRYRQAYDRKSQSVDGYFIAESQFLVERLLQSPFEVDSILVDSLEKLPDCVFDRRMVPVFHLERAEIQKLVGFNFHRGIMASGKRLPRSSIDAIQALIPAGRSTILAASKIVALENLGTLIRNACAFGADAILLDRECADPFARRCLRVSTGHAFKIPIVESSDFLADLNRLKELGFSSFATVIQEDATPLKNVVRAERSVLMMGNEGYGLSPEVIQKSDARITIPMHRGSDSLNVAMATGIFLYHFCHLQ